MSKVFLALLTILFFFSCTKEVKFKPEDIEPQIVVNSIIFPDDYINVNIHKTADIFDTVPVQVDNAIVEIWNEKNLIEKLTMDSAGYYSTKNYKAETKKIYTLRVNIEGFVEITAKDIVPDKTDVFVSDFEPSTYSDQYIDNFYKLNLKFDNKNNELNYYQLLFPYMLMFSSFPRNFMSPFYTNDAIIKSADNFPYIGNNIQYSVFSNNKINDDSILITTELMTCESCINYHDGNYFDTTEKYKLIVLLNSISENYYKYLKSKIIAYEAAVSSDGLVNEYYLYSNIENGLGIFAGCNPSVDTLVWHGEIMVK